VNEGSFVTRPPTPRKTKQLVAYAFVPHWFLIVTGAAAAGAIGLLLIMFSGIAGYVFGQF